MTMAMRDVWPHEHGKLTHSHAWSSIVHDHTLRQVCTRPECSDADTHNIHQGLPSIEGVPKSA